MSSPEPSASLCIARTSPNDIGIRDLYVVVDEQEEQTLLNGQTMTLLLEPGPHKVKVTNRLFSRVAHFTVKPGESAKFVASNRGIGGLFSILTVIGGTGAYRVTLEQHV